MSDNIPPKNYYSQYLNAINEIFKLTKFPFSRRIIENYLLNHPSYPSLLAVSDAFYYFGIDNLHIKIEEGLIQDIPLPAIAKLKNDKIIVVLKINDQFIEYFDAIDRKHRTGQVKEFKEKWINKLIIIEEQPQFDYDTMLKHKKNKRKVLLSQISKYTMLIFVGIFLLIPSILLNQIFIYLYYILNVLGLGIVLLLLFKESFGSKDIISNPIFEKICTFGGNKSDCNDVLASDAAYALGLISMIELGLLFFLTNLVVISVAVLIGSSLMKILSVAFLFTILSLPYTIFSIYYQGIVVKKWCPFCVGVQIILWLLFASFLFYDVPLLKINISFLALYIGTGLILSSIWRLLFSLYKENIHLKKTEWIRNWYVKNPEVFTYLVRQQKIYSIPHFSNELILGNPLGGVELTAVLHFKCISCVQTFQELKKIATFYSNVRINIRFDLIHNDELTLKVAQTLLSAAQESSDKAVKVLDSWLSYMVSGKSFEEWVNGLPQKFGSTELLNIESQYNQYEQWLRYTNVNNTPAFFLNGHLIPWVYQIKEIKHHIRYWNDSYQGNGTYKKLNKQVNSV